MLAPAFSPFPTMLCTLIERNSIILSVFLLPSSKLSNGTNDFVSFDKLTDYALKATGLYLLVCQNEDLPFSSKLQYLSQ